MRITHVSLCCWPSHISQGFFFALLWRPAHALPLLWPTLRVNWIVWPLILLAQAEAHRIIYICSCVLGRVCTRPLLAFNGDEMPEEQNTNNRIHFDFEGLRACFRRCFFASKYADVSRILIFHVYYLEINSHKPVIYFCTEIKITTVCLWMLVWGGNNPLFAFQRLAFRFSYIFCLRSSHPIPR